MRFVTRVHINKPPGIVNQAYTDPENIPFWTKHLEKFEVVKGNSMEKDTDPVSQARGSLQRWRP